MSNGKPGRAPEEAKRAFFIELISAGATIADAGRQVSVNYRTARRWVKGRTITPLTARLAANPEHPADLGIVHALAS